MDFISRHLVGGTILDVYIINLMDIFEVCLQVERRTPRLSREGYSSPSFLSRGLFNSCLVFYMRARHGI